MLWGDGIWSSEIPTLVAELPDIDSDASTKSEGEGGNTDNDLSDLDELDISELAGENAR